MNTLTLTPAQLDTVLDEAKAEVVATIMAKHGADLTLVSKAQAAGLLDVDSKTLDTLPIPRVVIAAKKKIAYRLSDLVKFIEDNIER